MRKLKKLLIILLLIFIVIIYFIFVNKFDIYNKSFICKIKNNYDNYEEIDISKIEKVAYKKIKKENKNSNDYFILGYYNYLKKDNNNANKYFKLTIKNLNKNTHEFAKIFSYKQIISNEANNEKAVEYVKEALNNINIKKYNDYYKDIWDICHNIKKKNLVIDFYENIINKVMLNEKSEKFTYSMLSEIYYLNGEYSKTIEVCLKIIDGKNTTEASSYYKGKALVNLSAVYRSIGSYDKSKEILKKLDDLEFKDLQQSSYVYTYALLNLAELNIRLGNYTEAIKNLENLTIYKRYFTKEDLRENEIIAKLLLAEANINLGEFTKAEKLINRVSKLIENKKDLDSSKEIYCDLLKGKLFEKKGEKEKAVQIYKESLNLAKEINSAEYIIKSYMYLIKYYEDNGECKNQNKYLNEKSEYLDKRNASINEDSAEYVSEKHIYEELIMKNIKKQYLFYLIIFISFSILIVFSVLIKNLIYKNNHDVLTGVYSREYFNKKYNKYIKLNKDFSIIMFDVDNFKKINDTYGHNFGDIVLIDISRRIKALLHNKIFLFRIGGEEFIIIVKNKSKDEVYNIAEKIRSSVSEMKWNKDITVTVSMGIAHFNNELENVLKRADENLYVSKQTGKNKITV